MKKQEGKVPNKIKFTDGVYVNTNCYSGMYIYYGQKSLGGKKWIWGVVEYLGQYYNLDDPYDVQLCFLALIYTGVIQKFGAHYVIIDPKIISSEDCFRNKHPMQDLTLLANLQGRTLRVLNEKEIYEYNRSL